MRLTDRAWLSSPRTVGHYLTRDLAAEDRYRSYPHVRTLSRELVKLVGPDPEYQRLAIALPPRSGKTVLASIWFVVWYLAHHPNRKVIVASHGHAYASQLGQKIRDVIEEHGLDGTGELNVRIRKDSRAKGWWTTPEGGGVLAVGRGSSVTGRGADCLAAGTLVSSPTGPARIEDIAPGDEVWSRDAASGKVISSTVRATRAVHADETCTVTLASGRRVRATPDHRVFVDGRGYVEAASLRPGDEVLAIVEPLPGLQRSDERDIEGPMLAVLSRGEAVGHRAHLRPVQGNGGQEGLRDSEVDQEGTHGCLLLEEVQRGAPRGQEQAALQRVRSTCSEEDNEVLRPDVSAGRAPAKAVVSPVCDVRRRVSSAHFQAHVLFEEVRQRGAQRAHEGRGQLVASGRLIPCPDGQEDSAAHPGAGRQRVCDLPREGRPALASQRRGPGEQQPPKPGHLVPVVPSSSPQVERDTVALVERGGPGGVVYDLQVDQRNPCFFAGGVLVHNCLVLDDLFDGMKDAYSATIRESVWRWYLGTILPRLNDVTARVVALNTRWHHDDLIGRLERQQEDEDYAGPLWRFVRMPAVSDDDLDPLDHRTEPGLALNPERRDIDYWNAHQQELSKTPIGYYIWTAEYQGRPTPLEGNLVKLEWFRGYTRRGGVLVLEDGDEVRLNEAHVFATADLAISDSDQADYTAVGVFASHEGRLCVLEMTRVKRKGTAQVELLEQVHRRHRCVVWVEQAVHGLMVIEQLRKKGVPVKPLKPDRSKIARFIPLTAAMEAGQVYFAKAAHWYGDLESELLRFPLGDNDDQCLVAGTLVSTNDGLVPIERIERGCRVWTRAGLRRVVFSGLTGVQQPLVTIHLSTGATLTGTPNHPVYVRGRGFVRLDALRYGDALISEEDHPCRESKPLSFRAEPTGGIRSRPGEAIASTSRSTIPRVPSGTSTETCTRPTTDRSLPAGSCITSMGTPSTTIPRTSRRCRTETTFATIAPTSRRISFNEGESTSPESGPKQPRGIARRKVEPGIADTPLRTRGKRGQERGSGRSAPLAERGTASPPLVPESPGSVRRSALLGTAGALESMTRTESVRSARRPFGSTSTPRPRPAPVRVVSVEETGRGDVFNLAVEGEPEYFANGVLVHNCDVLGYGHRVAFVKTPRQPPTPPRGKHPRTHGGSLKPPEALFPPGM